MRSLSQWIILRCAGRSTVPLADSLSKAGYEAWTPIAFIMPRKRADEPVRAPITPTYVFARAAHLFEMIGLAANPGPQHDGFSVMRTPQGIPLVGDGALAFLREEEATEKARADRLSRARHRRSKPTGGPLDVGEAITMPAATGAWAGMTGFVAQSDPRKTVVSLSLFGRAQDIEIETFILRPNAVSADEQIAA